MGISADHINIIGNGQVLELLDGEMYLGEKISTSFVFVDGSKVGEVSVDVNARA